LHNAAGNLGVSLGFNIQQLPVFSMEKHRHYGARICYGLGTRHQLGLQPQLSAGVEPRPYDWSQEQRHFDITYTFLADKSAVDSALQQVQKIQHDRPTEVRKSPLVELPKN
jgi:hypothetical protein